MGGSAKRSEFTKLMVASITHLLSTSTIRIIYFLYTSTIPDFSNAMKHLDNAYTAKEQYRRNV